MGWIGKTKSMSVFIALIVLTLVTLMASWFFLWGNSHNKPIRVSVILKSAADSMDYWQVLSDGVTVAAKEYDVQVDITGPDYEADIDRQIELIEQARLSKPDAIVLAVTDFERLKPYAQKILDDNIPLITIDSGLNGDMPETLIATDNIEAGKKAGQKLVEIAGDRSKIAIISYVKGTTSQMHREQGVRSIIEKDPRIQIMGTFYSESNEHIAYKHTKELLLQDEDITGIVGLNEPSTVGAGRAIKDLGLQKKIQLIGFDSSLAEVKLIQEGVLLATIVQRPFNMGYLSIRTALDKMQGKKVAPYVDTGSVVITKENMNEDENQKLLFPFVGE